jgi:sterol desaturase/sphingolipid hydroxylase (fatty acid hydroxylase superfamily)
MPVQVISPLVICLTAVLFIALERAFPYDKGQRILRQGFWTDLIWYTIIQSYVLALVISAIIMWTDHHTGLSRFHIVSVWPISIQILFFFVIHDFYIYWFHRLQHHSPILWRIHEAHHSVRDVDWLAGSRSHSLEILINQTIEFMPMTLLGAAPVVPIIKGMIDAIWGMYIHSNLDVHTGKFQRFINGPEMHRWHHAIEITEGGINFATKLAIWDWLFGTKYLPEAKPSGYGLAGVNFPKNYFAQHVFAFRRFSEQPQDSLQRNQVKTTVREYVP